MFLVCLRPFRARANHRIGGEQRRVTYLHRAYLRRLLLKGKCNASRSNYVLIPYQNLIKRLELSGKDITQHLRKLLLHNGSPIHPTRDHQYLRHMKERFCHISEDGHHCGRIEEFVLPDKRVIHLCTEKVQAPEILFDPSLYHCDSPGIPDMIFNSVQESDMNLRSDFYRNIVLAGGSTMFQGFKSRLETEVRLRYIAKTLQNDSEKYRKGRIRILDVPNRDQTAFVGGCILADMMQLNSEFWVSKREYDENGLHHCLIRLNPK